MYNEEEVRAQKSQMRSRMLSQRIHIGSEQALCAGRDMILHLLTLPTLVQEQKNPKVIALFFPIKGEPDLLGNRDLLRNAGFHIALPKILDEQIHFYSYSDGDALETGRFLIPEPTICQKEVPTEHIRAICLPGLAFDRKGARLGYGKGYYDRFLTENAGYAPLLLGMSYDFQIVKEVLTEQHDRKMDFVITPNEIIHTDFR